MYIHIYLYIYIYIYVGNNNSKKDPDDGDISIRSPSNIQNSSAHKFSFRMEEKTMEEIKEDTIANGSFA
jgi:hypothetical protein